MGGKGWGFLYRLGRRWFTEGMYAEALAMMDPYDGAKAPTGYTLPPMKISGVIDDSQEDVVKSEAGERTTSTQGITARSAERVAA
ncbi:hypothetical protein SSP531S_06960 [Streptomyces spongiicola]|uniref:Uncharacterized protein n=1 Tax=Streptomyces spongiicola TaxID=1690221 RepID=A0A2S1YYR4_9ACTN|nr:hypothetical protein DDQ41_10175 [Streptomyces spongiicola]GBP99301.1 hypothetical protein SSP531S_06960 [Streptomyces spongiicola]